MYSFAVEYAARRSHKGEATAMVRMLRPDLPLEGPIQYDAAVDPIVAEAKLPGSTVAGHATVLIFPELNAGNNTYKAVQRTSGAVAIGPVLQGLNKPVNDLSEAPGCGTSSTPSPSPRPRRRPVGSGIAGPKRVDRADVNAADPSALTRRNRGLRGRFLTACDRAWS